MKYKNYAAATVLSLGAIGTGVYFGYVKDIFKPSAPKPDIGSDLDKFLEWLKEWLESHMGNGGPQQPPGEPGGPDSTALSTDVSSFSSSSHGSGEGNVFMNIVSDLFTQYWVAAVIVGALTVLAATAMHRQSVRPSGP